MSIDISRICANVYMVTANAAQQSGGVVNAATVDNTGIVASLVAEGVAEVCKAFGRYFCSVRTVYENGELLNNPAIISKDITYSTPANWLENEAGLMDCVELFLTNYAVARWYNLAQKEFPAKADYDEIINILSKRNKPE